MKNGELSQLKGIEASDILAVINNLGGRKNWERMRSGGWVIWFVEGDGHKTMINVKKGVKLYDRYGRVITPIRFSDPPLDADRRHKLTLSREREWHVFDLASLNLAECFDRIRPFVPSDCGITLPTREEIIQFLVYCEEIRTRLRKDEAQENILRGAHLPTILPKCEVTNHGALVEVFLTIAKRSYEAEFSGRKFHHPLQGQLVGNVGIVRESRFFEIRNRMSQEFVPGLTFFTPFQGYSISASRQMINLLPEECALSCFDTIWNWALYPDVLLNDWDTPAYDLAGFFLGSGSGFFGGKASGRFVCCGDKGAEDYRDCSSGIFLSR